MGSIKVGGENALDEGNDGKRSWREDEDGTMALVTRVFHLEARGLQLSSLLHLKMQKALQSKKMKILKLEELRDSDSSARHRQRTLNAWM